jgi:hypothetical protein
MIFVLTVEFTDDPNREVWAFETLVEAETFLRGFAEDFLVGYTLNEVPADAELVAEFNLANAFPRIYCCDVGGGSEEIEIGKRGRDPTDGLDLEGSHRRTGCSGDPQVSPAQRPTRLLGRLCRLGGGPITPPRLRTRLRPDCGPADDQRPLRSQRRSLQEASSLPGSTALVATF